MHQYQPSSNHQRGLAYRSMAKGLTLIEGLVAVSVLVVGVLGPLTIAARGISDGLFASNQMAATYLAQEAIEGVISHRNALRAASLLNPVPETPEGQSIFTYDTLSGGIASNSIADCRAHTDPLAGGEEDQYCSIDAIATNVSIGADCQYEEGEWDNASPDCVLVFDGSASKYKPLSSNPQDKVGTRFLRLLQLTHPEDDEDKLQVRVRVLWNNKNTPKEIEMVTYLFANG